MPSSTSSFSLRRLVWSAIACVAVLTGWQVLIWCHGLTPSTGIHQWEDNVIRVERFADKAQGDRPVVLVGSSLMARLDAAKIGSRVVNVALSGGSPRTGIELVRRHPTADVLVIEISALASREPDADLVGSALDGLAFIRQPLSVFRREFQPVSVLVSAWKNYLQSREKAPPKNSKSLAKTAARQVKGVKNTVAQYQQPLTEVQVLALKKGAEDMRRQLQEIQHSSSVRVFLDHVPLDPAVEATPMARQTLDILRATFAGPEWHWVPVPAGLVVETNDGLHLTAPSADAYAALLREWLITQGVALDP